MNILIKVSSSEGGLCFHNMHPSAPSPSEHALGL